ncbi:phage holin family protein [Lysobacter xanthus]
MGGSNTPPPPPELEESLRQVMAAGRASMGAVSDASKAFRGLLAADVSLARSAFGRSLAFAGLAVAFGASAWLLLMASTVVVLRAQVGLSWVVAMLACAGLSIVVCALAAWGAMRYFEHTRLKASRRQLARLGFGELADFTPAPGSARSAKSVEDADLTTASGAPIKDEVGVPVTPP